MISPIWQTRAYTANGTGRTSTPAVVNTRAVPAGKGGKQDKTNRFTYMNACELLHRHFGRETRRRMRSTAARAKIRGSKTHSQVCPKCSTRRTVRKAMQRAPVDKGARDAYARKKRGKVNFDLARGTRGRMRHAP